MTISLTSACHSVTGSHEIVVLSTMNRTGISDKEDGKGRNCVHRTRARQIEHLSNIDSPRIISVEHLAASNLRADE